MITENYDDDDDDGLLWGAYISPQTLSCYNGPRLRSETFLYHYTHASYL